jgi:uncharacterized protein (DUF1501 family)
MLCVSSPASHFRNPASRREFLRLGSLATIGLSLPELLQARAATEATKHGKAKACIFVFLQGGPAHLDCWDPKPGAPAEIRGEFRAIATSVPGTQVCEHLPRLARLADRYALIRSCTHDDPEHNSAAHCALTGRMHPRKGQLVGPSIDDFPPFGAALAKVRPTARAMPAWVTMPAYLLNSGTPFPSQNAGFLGSAFDPLAIRSDPNTPGFSVEGLSLPADVAVGRLAGRQSLLQKLDGLANRIDRAASIVAMERSAARAFDLILSPSARAAFRLAGEPAPARDRYGRTSFGQSLLLARRLVEAGVPLVTVYYTNETPRRPGCSISWDTHEDNFPDLKTKLLPDLDRGLSALQEDLGDRGLLAETLVIAAGEFGRSPKIGARLTGAGSTANGRDHWTKAYTVLWAGGGVRGGLVYGATDKIGAYPTIHPVTPEMLAASLYYALGVDPHAEVYDRQGRPHSLIIADPILPLFA